MKHVVLSVAAWWVFAAVVLALSDDNLMLKVWYYLSRSCYKIAYLAGRAGIASEQKYYEEIGT